MFLLKALCLMCLFWQTAMGITTLKIEPQENNVVEGETAVFTCTVTGRDKENEGIEWLGESGGVLWLYSPTSVQVISDPHGYLERVNFKNHTVVYNASYEEEVFELEINTLIKSDDDLQIDCVFSNLGLDSYFDGDSARLFVLSKPQCKVDSDIPLIIDDGETFPVTLTCTLEDGDPPPSLTWYKMQQNHLQSITGPSVNSTNTTLSITASDYGREYICQARVDALPYELILSCTVVPYQPKPPSKVTSSSTGLIQALIAVAVIGWCIFITVIIILLIYCLRRKFVGSEPDEAKCEKAAEIPMTSSVNNEASNLDLQANDIASHVSPSTADIPMTSLANSEASYQNIQTDDIVCHTYLSFSTAEIPMTSSVNNETSYQDLQANDIASHTYASPSTAEIPLTMSVNNEASYQDLQANDITSHTYVYPSTADIPMTSSINNEASYQDLQTDDIASHAYASPSVYAIQSVKEPANVSEDNEAYQEIN